MRPQILLLFTREMCPGHTLPVHHLPHQILNFDITHLFKNVSIQICQFLSIYVNQIKELQRLQMVFSGPGLTWKFKHHGQRTHFA